MTKELINRIETELANIKKTNQITRNHFFSICKDALHPKILPTSCVPCIKRYIVQLEDVVAKYYAEQSKVEEELIQSIETLEKEIEESKENKKKSKTKKSK